MNFSLREWKQFRKLTLLIEGRIDDAKKAAPLVMAISQVVKKFNPNENSFVEEWVKRDPSGNQKYLVWVMKEAEADLKRYYHSNYSKMLDMFNEFLDKGYVATDDDEDIDPERRKELSNNVVKEAVNRVWRKMIEGFGSRVGMLKRFDELVKRKLIRGKETDINQYTDFSAVANMIDEVEEEIEKKEQQKQAERNIDVIHKDEDFFIFEPLAFEASCHYAQRYGERGTKWCISSDDYPRYWEEFAANDNKFVFVFNKHGDKFSIQNNEWDRPQDIAGHTANHGTTVWDAADNPMSFSEFIDHSGVTPELVEKITDHYADNHGMEIQNERSSNEEELEEARSMWERMKDEEERVQELNMDVVLDLTDDEDGDFQILDLGFTIYLPRALFKDEHSVREAFDDAEDTIQEMIDNNHDIDGYAHSVSFESDPGRPGTYGIHVSYDGNTFSAASDFYDYISSFVYSVYSVAGYDFHDEKITIEDLPSLTKKIFYAMAVEDPDATVADLPEYEHFSYVLEEHPSFDAAMTSPRFKVGRYPADVTGPQRSDFSKAVKERLVKWLSNAISAEQLELGRSPNKELATERKWHTDNTLNRWLEVHPRVDWSSANDQTMDLVIRMFQELPPEKGSTPLLATEIMDENWDVVRQIAVRQFAESFPDTPLTEGIKKRRKMRIKFR